MRSGPHTASMQFLGSLRDFFREETAGYCIREVNFRLHPAAKDLIESLGVPHVEIFGLQVNNRFQSLAYNVQNGDELAVYPKGEARKLPKEKQFKRPSQIPKHFVADVHLGKLARRLRLLGINTAYANNMNDAEIIEKATEEDSTVLTRDLELLKNGSLQWGYWLRATDPEHQVREVLDYFEFGNQIQPFSRCMNCNGLLEPATKADILDQIPPKVKQWCDEYWRCSDCEQIYWRGSHYKELLKKVDQILDS